MELSYFFVVFQPRSYVAFTRARAAPHVEFTTSRRCVPWQPGRSWDSVQLAQFPRDRRTKCLLVGFIIVHTQRVCVFFCLITNARTLSSVYYSFRVEHNVHVDRVRCANRRPWLSLVCDGRRLPVVSPHTVLLPRALYAVSSYVFALQIAVALSRFFF